MSRNAKLLALGTVGVLVLVSGILSRSFAAWTNFGILVAAWPSGSPSFRT
jgi:hypothetical protein